MDDWGDPWADNSNNEPPKLEVAHHASKAQNLPGWSEGRNWADADTGDADWGDFEDPWSATEEKDVRKLGNAEDFAADQAPWTPRPDVQNFAEEAQREENTSETGSVHAEDEEFELSDEIDAEAVTKAEEQTQTRPQSENSKLDPDPQSRESVQQSSADVILGREEDSTRPPTPRSDESSPEVSLGSPRTSLEDERRSKTDILNLHPSSESLETESDSSDGNDQEEEIRSISQSLSDDQTPTAPLASSQDDGIEHGQDVTTHVDASLVAPSLGCSIPSSDSFKIDKSVIGHLLSPAPQGSFTEADDGPLAATSSKKAWYRLTRQETMREFNSGADDNNYVRITWQNSAVRTETHSTVRRWMIEDRANGKPSLGRQGAAFGWDQPAPTISNVSKKFPVSASPQIPSIEPSKKSSIDVPSSPVASFGWSSSPSSESRGSKGNESIETTRTEVQEEKEIDIPKILIAPIPAPRIRPMSTDFSSQSFQYKHRKGTRSVSSSKSPLGGPSIDAVMHSAGQKDLSISPMVPNHKLQSPAVASPLKQVMAQEHIEESRIDSESESDPQIAPLPVSQVIAIPEVDDDWGDMIRSPAEPAVESIQITVPVADAYSPLTKVSSTSKDLPDLPKTTSHMAAFDTDLPLDPWASADLSTFEEVPPPPPPKLPTLQTQHSRHSSVASNIHQTLHSRHSSAASTAHGTPQPPGSATIAPGSALEPQSSTLSLTPTTPSKAQLEVSQSNEAVRSIISNLPDLSYMTL